MSKKQLQRERAARREEKGTKVGFVPWAEQPLVERISKRKLPPGQSYPLGFEEVRDGVGAEALSRFSISFSKGPDHLRHGIHLIDVTWREGDPFGPHHTPCHLGVHGVPSAHRAGLAKALKEVALPMLGEWILQQDADEVGPPVRQVQVRYEDHWISTCGGLVVERKKDAEKWKWAQLVRVADFRLPGREKDER